jgi:tRNA modification GTPase
MDEETIAAIATPLGESGLAVVRVSGPTALGIVDRCFVPAGKRNFKPSNAPSHTIQYGRIQASGKTLDEVMVSVLRAPRTFTREDMVEISCHGGILPAKLVLEALLENGARLAAPGEFTKRAFLNGRIDLTQAEAVADLIHARTELSLRAAHEQLSGKLGAKINEVRDGMMRILAHVEAHIDFPDEDIQPDTREQLIESLSEAAQFMSQLIASGSEGQVLRRGIRIAIVGRPNAGKSSLLNQLLGHDRAIVSPIPGTTRDTIEETASILGIPVVFIDTAGLRKSGDEIEMEGIRRSKDSLEKADLVLHVIDASQELHPEDAAFAEEFAPRRYRVVLNKSDLAPRTELPSGFRISALTGAGLDSLKTGIRDLFWQGEVGGEMWEVMINSRHLAALKNAHSFTQTTIQALNDDIALELTALDLRLAVQALGEIVGKTTTEDLLDSIFSQFCLGK